MTTQLVLVKHSEPEIIRGVPAHEWRLSLRGRENARVLGEVLRERQPARIVSSVEPKAVETARIVADTLGTVAEALDGLHEHERSRVGLLEPEAFTHAVRYMFDRPHETVFGDESAHRAATRFQSAMTALLERHQREHAGENLIVVTHGTVLSLYVAALSATSPFTMWERLGLPSYVVLSLPELAVVEMCDRVGE